MNNTPIWTGLESLALALIFIPEPVTTVIGVGLLGYVQKKRIEQQQASRHHRLPYLFRDYYNCKVQMIRGSSIAYRVSTTREGQLPLARSTIARLYESRREWEYYHKTLNARPRITATRSSAQQPAGLLKTPVLRYQSGLKPRRVEI